MNSSNKGHTFTNNHNQNNGINSRPVEPIKEIFIVNDRAQETKRIERILYPSVSTADPHKVNTNNRVLVLHEEPSGKIVSKSMPSHTNANVMHKENEKYNSNSESNLISEWSTSSEYFENHAPQNLKKNIHPYKLRRPRPMPKWQPTFR